MWPFNRNVKRLALAENEMLKAMQILSWQIQDLTESLNEIIDAVNKFGAVVGLEWNQTDKKWLRPQ